jgi:hypothetical protein
MTSNQTATATLATHAHEAVRALNHATITGREGDRA